MDRIAGMTLTREPEEPGIIGSLVEAHSIPGFEEAVSDYDGDGVLGTTADALTTITRAAARAFVAHPGPAIAMVHSLTGPAAVQLVLPHLPPELRGPSLAMSWKVSASIIGAFAGPPAPGPRPGHGAGRR